MNSHASFRINCKVDPILLAKNLKNAVYNPKKIRAVIVKLKEPKATVFVFASGKGFCLGTRSEQEAKLATKKVAKMILKFYPEVRYSNF